MSALRLGTRGSALALAQAGMVAEMIGEDVELVTITTSGDEGPAAVHEDKSRFVKEIETALLEERIDLAVHSAKDVPAQLPEGLAIVGVPARADPLDSLCGEATSLADLPEGAAVGTASLRRRSQLLALRPDLRVSELRGNVDTRLRKLEAGEHDAIVLAAAGLERLGRGEGRRIPLAEMVPAAGQGCLALEARAGHQRAVALGRRLTDHHALVALTAERALITALGATCHTPVGACAESVDGALVLHGFVGLPDGGSWIRDAMEGHAEDPAGLGAAAAVRLDTLGARELLAGAEAA